MQITRFKNRTGTLRVAANRRYLEFDDGTPFFYLGDTAWSLFHRLNLDEARYYLSNRSDKGFTVIQAVVISEFGEFSVPNANGDIPLIDRNPTTPNEKYFRHVDDIVKIAEESGLFMGILPTWGSGWKLVGEDTNPIFTVGNARIYGRYMGERYRDNAVIWILGGDQNIENDEEHAIIEALALGIREGDEGAHLITFHPRGPGRSAEFIHEAEWLDFNMCQSSHGARDHDNGIFIEYDYALEPTKPTLDGEPRYEMIPVGFYYKETSRYDRFDDYDTRQAAYWALFSGACGHTYGHNCVFQFWTPDKQPGIWANIPWTDSLDTPGAFQMGLVRRLFESYRFNDLVPAQNLVVDGSSSGGAKIKAMKSRDNTCALVYSPRGESFSIDRRMFKPHHFRESWYDPRYGCTYYLHSTNTLSLQTYTPPTSGRGNDWILVIEAE